MTRTPWGGAPWTPTSPEVAVDQIDHQWSPLDCSLLAKWLHMNGGREYYRKGDERFVPLQFAPLVCVLRERDYALQHMHMQGTRERVSRMVEDDLKRMFGDAVRSVLLQCMY